MVPQTSPPKRCLRFFVYVIFFSYNLLKFDIVNADLPLCKRGNNLEMEAKLNKARQAFLNEVSLNVAVDFQLISSEDARIRTKNVHRYMLFYSIEKKTRNVS